VPQERPPAGLAGLYELGPGQTRSICPENFTGGKGQGAMATQGTRQAAAAGLGRGWKVSPSIDIQARSTVTLAEVAGPGCIHHIWMTPTGNWRYAILRCYWDDETEPSIECPVGDFFACGLGQPCPINSLAVCVNPASALNCYWPMPFRKKARITLENLDDRPMTLFYQVDYALAPVAARAAYLHAQFRREYPLKSRGLYTLLDGVRGRGQYVGTYLAWQTRAPAWWGEGEIKFYLDGDSDFPTIAGTGAEDYFCGSYDFENFDTHRYQTFCTPYAGLAQVLPPDRIYQAGQRFGMYRWHLTDPIRFDRDLRVTIQALGWQENPHRYLPLEDDVSSVAYWYQVEPHAPFPKLPDRAGLAWPPPPGAGQ
jgi:hypothetical protein